MRTIITAVAAIAVSGLLASTAVRAEPLFQPGGPSQIGAACQVNEDYNGDLKYGYLQPCAPAKKVAVRSKKKSKKS